MNEIGTLVEIVDLALLAAAVYESRVRRKPKNHWRPMAAATLVDLVSEIFLMAPVFIDLAPVSEAVWVSGAGSTCSTIPSA